MRARLLATALVAVAVLLAGVALPAQGRSTLDLGRDPSGLDPASVPGSYRLPDGRWAMPLKSDKPAWLTPDVELAAKNGKGKPQAAPAAAPAIPGPPADAPAAGYVGIRPGSWIVSPAGCTTNFVFGTPGNYAI